MIDPTKYGVPIQENQDNKIDVSKYGTPVTPTKTPINQAENLKLQKDAKYLNSPVGLTIETTKGAIGSLLGTAAKFIKSAALSPVDITRGAMGKPPVNVGTIQSQFANKLNQPQYQGGLGVAQAGAEAVTDTALGALDVLGIGKGLTKLKNTQTTKWLQNTPETLTKAEEKIASLEGRVKTTLGGSKKILPSATEKRASQILKGKITSNVTKNPQIIQQEIAKRGAEAEKYLAQIPTKVTAAEQASLFANKRKAVEKVLDKSQLKAFDEQWKMFQKQLPGRGGYTTENFYKALKDYETNVASNLSRGKMALIDPTGVASAKIQGAKAVREIVRDLISSKHLGFKNKMYDLASLYDVLDTALTKSRQLTGSTLARFAENNPVLTKLGVGGAIAGGAYLLGKNNSSGGQTFSSINSLGNGQ